MLRQAYSLYHEKSEKNKVFWIVTWPISHRFRNNRRFPSKIANFSHPRVYTAPAGIGYRPRAPQSFNPALMAIKLDLRRARTLPRDLFAVANLLLVLTRLDVMTSQQSQDQDHDQDRKKLSLDCFEAHRIESILHRATAC